MSRRPILLFKLDISKAFDLMRWGIYLLTFKIEGSKKLRGRTR